MSIKGHYRFIWAYPNQYTTRPYFGRRQRYLPAVKQTTTQIMVPFQGTMIWINVDPGDLV